jgi:glutathione S-transferase
LNQTSTIGGSASLPALPASSKKCLPRFLSNVMTPETGDSGLGCRLRFDENARRAAQQERAMTRIQIIGAPFSSHVWVVRMVCEEKGVSYDLVPAGLHSPEVCAIHPIGKIPVMRHGDIALFESKAIATYIDKAFAGPKLIPDDALGAAEVEQWVSLVNTTIDPCLIRTYVLGHLVPGGADGNPDRFAIDGALPMMRTQIGALDRAVARTGYLAGESFTLADINLLPVLYFVQGFPEGAEMVQSAGNLSVYFAHHAGRPSYQASFPPPHTAEVIAAIRRSASEKRVERSSATL